MGKKKTNAVDVSAPPPLAVYTKQGDVWTHDQILEGACPFCFIRAVVELTPRLKALQPDGTTHVCHPGFGGCNHGFAQDEVKP